MTNKKPNKEFLEVSNEDNWISCFVCGGNLIQIRKAKFECSKCGQDFIADEEDMRK